MTDDSTPVLPKTDALYAELERLLAARSGTISRLEHARAVRNAFFAGQALTQWTNPSFIALRWMQSTERAELLKRVGLDVLAEVGG